MPETVAADPVHASIAKTLTDHPVVLFMKGTMAHPHCGFSAAVAQILGHIGVEVADFDVLKDEALRQGVKTYSNWPTYPQLYVDGELVGGADIVREMFQSGELQALLAKHLPAKS